MTEREVVMKGCTAIAVAAIACVAVTNMVSNPTCAIKLPGSPGLRPERVPKPFGVQSLGPNETVHYDNIGVYSLPTELVTGTTLRKGN